MKKLPVLLGLVLVLSLLLSPVAFASGGNYDTLADWDLRIAVPDNAASAVLKGNTYYIYAQNDGYIPYVMLMATSQFDSEEDFIDHLTDSLAEQYQRQGFKVTASPELKTFGDKLCYEVDYAYTVSGYAAVDRRVFITVGERTYMFCSKEIPSLGFTVDGMLEEVIENAVFLSEGTDTSSGPENSEGEQKELYPVYLYREEDGMPKYWLDLTGVFADNPVLHCYFRSGDPTFYERIFVLDINSAEYIDEDSVLVYDVYDSWGNNVSDWFSWFELDFDDEAVTMDIGRNEKTLAGGSGDNIQTGIYTMEPCAADASYECFDENGNLQYWMIPNEAGDVEVHGAVFRGGDPETYEEVYVLDRATSVQSNEYVTNYTTIYRNGSDVSRLFKSVVLSQVQSSYLLTVRPADSSAGSPDSTILSGTYTFDPFVRFVPAEPGPYSEETLGLLARQYYFLENLFYPPEAEVSANEDGSFTIHLYETVEQDGLPAHTATSAWYTVDAFGVGVNDVTGDEVYLAG